MKVRKRMVPQDQIAIEQGERLIIISTHRQSIIMSAYKRTGMEYVESHEFTFDQFFSLIKNLKPGIQNDVP